MTRKSARRASVAVGATLSLAALGAVPAATAHAASDNVVPLTGLGASWTASAQSLGAAPAHHQMSIRVYLAPRDEAALDAAVAAVSNPKSAQYRHFITPDQYRAQFGPTQAEIDSVTAWLQSAGLKTSVSSDLRFVSATGRATQAEKAFSVQLNVYNHAGAHVVAPSATPAAPANARSAVLAITGLDETKSLMHHDTAPPPPVFKNAHPCSTVYGQLQAKYQADYTTPLPKFQGHYLSYAPCGYVPSQLRGAYGVDKTSLTGKGVTVAIVDAYAAPTIAKDADTYARNHGDAPFSWQPTHQFTQTKMHPETHQSDCGPSGWFGEETLDVEAVHGMAPDANIHYYGARSCYDNDLLDALATVVNDNTATIVSNSWGEAGEYESTNAIHAYEQVFKQGALQGIGFYFSSGDSGDELQASGLKQTDYPTSDPWVTSVGGTSLGVGYGNSYLFEDGWGTTKFSLVNNAWSPIGYVYGAGGGFASMFPRPDYQQGVVASNYPGQSGRAVPDIAADADPNTGMLIGETQTFPDGSAQYAEYRIGGTSLACPLTAGMQALAEQAAGSRIGFANPAIYQVAAQQSSVLHDVTGANAPAGDVRADFANGFDESNGILYSVRTFGNDASLKAIPGWDDVTGLGTPTKDYPTALASVVTGS